MVFFFFLDSITDVDFLNGLMSSSSPISSTLSSSFKPTIVSQTSSTSSFMSLSNCVVILASALSAKSLPIIMLSSFQYSKDFPLKFFASGLDCKIKIICINLNN
ncbi:hypothetical protein AMTRI_Chr08g207770 [Amborella trichopoda]